MSRRAAGPDGPHDVAGRLRVRAARAGLELPAPLLDKLASYVTLLYRWNERMNLTALDGGDGLDRLIVEPLLAARYLASPAGRVIDIGSGGGSPAIPLRLAMRGGSLLMVEARARKAAFLREAVRQLGLQDTVVAARRFEALAREPALHGAFDALTLRAVKVDTGALRGLQAFVRDGGQLLLFETAGGPHASGAAVAPLTWRATHPLVESLRSHLVVLEKRPEA